MPKSAKPKKPAKKIYALSTEKLTEMVESDQTMHFREEHKQPISDHSQRWYDFWGKKCPTCKAEANVIMVVPNE
jgi:hypothetical protein